MFETETLLKYTDALYGLPSNNIPRYEEFRDMFSRGQILSKNWLVLALQEHLRPSDHQILIVGAWFGLLSFFIKKQSPHVSVTCVDQDARCKTFIDHLAARSGDNSWLSGITEDLFNYPYSSKDTVVINTACEHIENTSNWIDKIPSDTLLVLQSNNFIGPKEHINCAKSLADFKNQIGTNIQFLYTNTLDLKIYERYMIIGLKK